MGSMLVLALGLTGCQQTPPVPQKPASEAIADAIKSSENVKSSSFNIALKGDINAPKGETPSKVSMNLTISGNADSSSPKEPKANMKMTGVLSADQDSGKADLELRINKDALYANIATLTGTGMFNVPAEASQFLGKWWKFSIPAGSFDDAATKYLQGDAALTPQEKQVKDYFESGKIFTDVKFVGIEGNTHHYSATLDKKGLADFVVLAAESQGTKVTDAEKKDMQTQLAPLEMSIDMYVDRATGMISRLSGPVSYKEPVMGATAAFTYDITVGDFNKPVTVEVPANAMEVPLGGMMGTPVMGTPVMTSTDSEVVVQ